MSRSPFSKSLAPKRPGSRSFLVTQLLLASLVVVTSGYDLGAAAFWDVGYIGSEHWLEDCNYPSYGDPYCYDLFGSMTNLLGYEECDDNSSHPGDRYCSTMSAIKCLEDSTYATNLYTRIDDPFDYMYDSEDVFCGPWN